MSTRSATSNHPGDAASQQNETQPSQGTAAPTISKRLPGDERRRRILKAVRIVSAERGVSHLSVSAVAKQAGCTRSLFYHYFSDMDAAVEAAMDEAIEGFVSELERWNASRTVGDIEGALDSVAPLFKRLVADGHARLGQRSPLRRFSPPCSRARCALPMRNDRYRLHHPP